MTETEKKQQPTPVQEPTETLEAYLNRYGDYVRALPRTNPIAMPKYLQSENQRLRDAIKDSLYILDEVEHIIEGNITPKQYVATVVELLTNATKEIE